MVFSAGKAVLMCTIYFEISPSSKSITNASFVSVFDWCLEFVRLRGLSLTSSLSFNLCMNYMDGGHS